MPLTPDPWPLTPDLYKVNTTPRPEVGQARHNTWWRDVLRELTFPVFFRPPLKINLFPVHQPGDYKCRVGTYFSHFPIFLLFPTIFSTISIQGEKIFKKGKRFCGLPTGHYYCHPLDRKQTVFSKVALVCQFVCTRWQTWQLSYMIHSVCPSTCRGTAHGVCEEWLALMSKQWRGHHNTPQPTE